VRYLADRVAVMYLGHIVEMGATEQIFTPRSIPIPRRSCRRFRSPTPE
jgi:peptide/nickel transport system ATP-binding protein